MSEEKIESAVTGRKATSTPAPFANGAKHAAPGTSNSEGKEHQRRTAWPSAEGDQMVAQVIVWDTQRVKSSTKSMMVQFSPDGSSAAALPVNTDRNQFLGKSSTGKLILLEPSTGVVETYFARTGGGSGWVEPPFSRKRPLSYSSWSRGLPSGPTWTSDFLPAVRTLAS
jgi:hypothetical protein